MGERGWLRLAAALVVMLTVAGCVESDGDDGAAADPTTEAAELDLEALGLWDDGPCDERLDPLVVGMMTVFQSPVLSLEKNVHALEAAATAFNERGGANGACVEVVGCDDGANVDAAVDCVRRIDEAGVVVTVGDQGSAGPAEVSAAMAEAGIPRVASNVSFEDWGDRNAFPIDASGTGAGFLFPQALLDQDVHDIALIRVNIAAASAMRGMLEDLHADRDLDIVADLPVPAGTTDFTQFILAAEDAGAEGVALALGDQEAIQVTRAAQRLDSDLLLVRGFPHETTVGLGDFADRVVFLTSLPPPTTLDVPVYEVLRADLAASGDPDLQPATLESFTARPWVGLYALLWMIRDAELTEFSRDGVTELLRAASDVPMLGIFGDEDWTPDLDHPGLFQRAGTNHWATYRWDSEADAPDGLEGNFVLASQFRFDDILCGSPFGGSEPC